MRDVVRTSGLIRELTNGKQAQTQLKESRKEAVPQRHLLVLILFSWFKCQGTVMVFLIPETNSKSEVIIRLKQHSESKNRKFTLHEV